MPFLLNPVCCNERCFLISGKECLLHSDCSELSFLELIDFKKRFSKSLFIQEVNVFTVLLLQEDEFLLFKESSECSSKFTVKTLREYFFKNEEEKSAPLFRAKHISEWVQKMKFCPSCASSLGFHTELSALECSSCKKIYFPRIEPCVIVAVFNKEGKILLARHKNRDTKIYACIAGFIEAGESAEMAVHREVFEETGLKIKNVTYKGSQSWPFPDQLMLAFTAEYESGTIKIQESEITEASWFSLDNLPLSPNPGSVAYKLIHGLF